MSVARRAPGRRACACAALAGVLALGACAGDPFEAVRQSVVVPFAPSPALGLYNWNVDVEAMGGDRYHFVLRKVRFTTGGDGEVLPALRNSADALARARGYVAYEILTLTESVESTLPVAQRVSRGVVQFVRAAGPAFP